MFYYMSVGKTWI